MDYFYVGKGLHKNNPILLVVKKKDCYYGGTSVYKIVTS